MPLKIYIKSVKIIYPHHLAQNFELVISELLNPEIEGFEIKAAVENGEIVISANREGMLSLAKHLTALADGIPGDHIHYDVINSLEDGSTEMIIERT